ncbi:MAG: DNA polymerase II [Treponema sp.]|jgi:DNA polymerase-2|nr:DNA polymerase II [Treponema sp.]
MNICHGFILHSYADLRRNSLYILGRLADGHSFAVSVSRWRPYIHIYESDRERVSVLLRQFHFRYQDSDLEDFFGKETLLRLEFALHAERSRAAKLIGEAGIPSPDGDAKPQDLYLSERHIRGPVEIRGESRPGRRIDFVFADPELSTIPADFGTRFWPLRIASIDIETDTGTNAVRAVGIVWTDSLLRPAGTRGGTAGTEGRLVRVVSPASRAYRENSKGPVFHPDERSLLAAFLDDIRSIDPDVLTGWNFLEFDYRILSERCISLALPFTLGRSLEEAKYFAGDKQGTAFSWRRGRSSAALVPGRQVIDALRVLRAGGRDMLGGSDSGEGTLADFSLETVARSALGEGKVRIDKNACFAAGEPNAPRRETAGFEKEPTGFPDKPTIFSNGEEKIAALDRLYVEDPERFGEYCLRDAELVTGILEKTGLFRLTAERAVLTGVSLDKAWTSVVSFERIYGMELRKAGIAPPPDDPGRKVSGAAGGTVLDPAPGLFENIAVFDFRSLYPSIMRTFNIDPLSHAQAVEGSLDAAQRLQVRPNTLHRRPGGIHARIESEAKEGDLITAPNGAAFSRVPGLLPALIGTYFAERQKALDENNETAAQVYKILMNSFYGVLGTASCRYGRTELAGAITSFARKWLFLSRDWFSEKGRRVLYGDTDSLFVETGLGDGSEYNHFDRLCKNLAAELNSFLAERIKEEYGLESFIELRFEKVYRRFLIPHLRGAFQRGEQAEAKGRAKGYGGYLLIPDGRCRIEVKGMEAVRSDSTSLARRLQLELLELVFSGKGEEAFTAKLRETLQLLRNGKLDAELVYRKRLTRPPEAYTASTPPHVKAARLLGWKGRRGRVEYVWTKNGAEPLSLPHGPLDYEHYAETQIVPVALSIAAAAHWNLFKSGLTKGWEEGQIELEFDTGV